MTMAPFLLAEDVGGGLGILAVLVALGGMLLAIVWLLFPFIVNGKMNSMIREARETNRLLKYLAEKNRDAKVPPTLPDKADAPVRAVPPKGEVYRI
jgi:hypothetical protein